jgi:hypothetical protein
MRRGAFGPPYFKPMIIKSNKIREGFQGMQSHGDITKFHHLERVDGIMEQAQNMREFSNNGWTKEKNMRQVASLPSTVVLKYPELLQDKTGKLLRKFLQGEEGRMYACVNPNTI